MKREDGDYQLGGGCGDKRFTLTWMLVKVVLMAAWIAGDRRSRR